jgi:hypothetical protein
MPDLTPREPVRWLNYRGQVSVDFTEPLGPNTMGEYLWPVAAHFDPATGCTRVGLSFIAPPAVIS